MGMNFEEGLEKLKERHEALTQTVEIVAGMQRENEKRMVQVLETISRIGNLEGNSR